MESVKEKKGIFKRFTSMCVRVMERWLPDPFIFCALLTFLVFGGALIFTKASFIKQCKNTRDSSTRRVLVMRHVLVEYELHEDFSKHIGKLVCRHGAKPCNKETELLGTLKASITTT